MSSSFPDTPCVLCPSVGVVLKGGLSGAAVLWQSDQSCLGFVRDLSRPVDVWTDRRDAKTPGDQGDRPGKGHLGTLKSLLQKKLEYVYLCIV